MGKENERFKEVRGENRDKDLRQFEAAKKNKCEVLRLQLTFS